MVKRPKSPDIVDDAKFLICHHPWPMNPNWEVKEDYVRFLQWIALIVGPDALFAFYYKPKARRTVLVEIDRTCPKLDKLLGEHRWDEFLVRPTAEERGCNSKIFFSIYDTERSAQKDGWKRIHIQSSWFKNWVVDEMTVRIPYPDTYWCDIPGATEDPTNKGLSRFLPKSMKPRPPKVVVPVVGSNEWIIQRLSESSSARIQVPPIRAPPPHHPSSPMPTSRTWKSPIQSDSPPRASFYAEDCRVEVTSLGGSPVPTRDTNSSDRETKHSRKPSIGVSSPEPKHPSSFATSPASASPRGLAQPSGSAPLLGFPSPPAKPLSPGQVQVKPTATHSSTAPPSASMQVIPRPLQTFVQMVREQAAALGILVPQAGLAPPYTYTHDNYPASSKGMTVCEGGRGLGLSKEKNGCEGEQEVLNEAQDEEGQEKEVDIVLGGEVQAGADSDREIINPFESLAWLQPGAEAAWNVIPEGVVDAFVSRRPVSSQAPGDCWGSSRLERPTRDHGHCQGEARGQYMGHYQRKAQDWDHGCYQDEARNHGRYQDETRSQAYERYQMDGRLHDRGSYQDQGRVSDIDYRGRCPQATFMAGGRELQRLEKQDQDQCFREEPREYPQLCNHLHNGPQYCGPQSYGHNQTEPPSSEPPILKWGDEPFPEPQAEPEFDFDTLPWLRPGAEAAWDVDGAIKPGFMYDRRAGVVAGIGMSGHRMEVRAFSGSAGGARDFSARDAPSHGAYDNSVAGSGAGLGLVMGYDRVYESEGLCPRHGVLCDERCEIGRRMFERSIGDWSHDDVRNGGRRNYEDRRGVGRGKGRGTGRGYVPRATRLGGYDEGYGGDRYA